MWQMETDETDALSRAKAGDHQAFGILMRMHCQVVFRVAFRMVADEADAEEITQEVFLRAFQKLKEYRFQSSFKTWLVAIAMNTAYNFIKRKRRDLVYNAASISTGDNALSHSLHIADRRVNPEQQVLEKERTKMRLAAMSRLSSMEQTAFLLRHLEGTPLAEIAVVLGVPVNSVKHAIFRAVSKLRRDLDTSSEASLEL